ncbi:MAG: 2-oxo acid dehydrogenase subunit E2 [Clostridiaceae bacterium]|nr:2-oxo acid dehydrogenase subunit E2 [Clostridiaceae bacterium]
MATAVIMPRQGQSVESCLIGEWHVRRGDQVKKDDPLFTYETDKATFDEVSPVDGEVIAVFFEEGDDVPVLLNVLVIGQAGEDWKEFIPEGASADGADQTADAGSTKVDAPEKSQAIAAHAVKQDPVPISPKASPVDAPISPRARTLATKSKADLRYASGSGPGGRIIERDINALVAAGHLATSAAGADYTAGISGSGIGGRVRVDDLDQIPAISVQETPAASLPLSELPEYEDIKLSGIRKIIGDAMHSSLTNMAQLTLNTSFDAGDIIEFRNRLKEAKTKGLDQLLGFSLLEKVPTFNDIILYAVSRTVLRYPDCNAHLLDDKMRHFNHVHLGMAVDTPRGLMVPVIRNADSMSIREIAAEAVSLAEAAQSGAINPDLLSGSTITISNLGSLGIESFTPVINPPETCLLGVNNISTRLRMEDGEAVPYQAMGLSLTFDHRAVDGAPAARFLQGLVKNLENFQLLMMEN